MIIMRVGSSGFRNSRYLARFEVNGIVYICEICQFLHKRFLNNDNAKIPP